MKQGHETGEQDRENRREHRQPPFLPGDRTAIGMDSTVPEAISSIIDASRDSNEQPGLTLKWTRFSRASAGVDPGSPVGPQEQTVCLVVAGDPTRLRVPGQRPPGPHGQIRPDQSAVEIWPSSMSATGRPPTRSLPGNHSCGERIAGATCFSRSFSALSSDTAQLVTRPPVDRLALT